VVTTHMKATRAPAFGRVNRSEYYKHFDEWPKASESNRHNSAKPRTTSSFFLLISPSPQAAALFHTLVLSKSSLPLRSPHSGRGLAQQPVVCDVLHGQEHLRVQAGGGCAGEGVSGAPGRGERHQVGPSGEPLGVLLRRLHCQGERGVIVGGVLGFLSRPRMLMKCRDVNFCLKIFLCPENRLRDLRGCSSFGRFSVCGAVEEFFRVRRGVWRLRCKFGLGASEEVVLWRCKTALADGSGKVWLRVGRRKGAQSGPWQGVGVCKVCRGCAKVLTRAFKDAGAEGFCRSCLSPVEL
jgi:hypothetical protein